MHPKRNDVFVFQKIKMREEGVKKNDTAIQFEAVIDHLHVHLYSATSNSITSLHSLSHVYITLINFIQVNRLIFYNGKTCHVRLQK